MTKKMKAAIGGAVVLVGLSYYLNNSASEVEGKKTLSRGEMQIRSQEYAAKTKAAADAKADARTGGVPVPAFNPPAANPPLPSVSEFKPQPEVAALAPAEPTKPVAEESAKQNLQDLAKAELASGIGGPSAPVTPIAAAYQMPETVTVTDTRQSFHPGPRSIYLQVSGGAVVWVKLSTRIAEADADSISQKLKGACFGLANEGKECKSQVEVDPTFFDHLKACSEFTRDSEAQILGQQRLQAKYFLFCPPEGNCWSESTTKLNLISKAPLEAGEAVGEVEALILPSGGCAKGPRAPASTADLVIEKIMQTSKVSPL